MEQQTSQFHWKVQVAKRQSVLISTRPTISKPLSTKQVSIPCQYGGFRKAVQQVSILRPRSVKRNMSDSQYRLLSSTWAGCKEYDHKPTLWLVGSSNGSTTCLVFGSNITSFSSRTPEICNFHGWSGPCRSFFQGFDSGPTISFYISFNDQFYSQLPNFSVNEV